MSRDPLERADSYGRERNSEPTNCSLGDTVQTDDPYNVAAAYIKQKPASHCCTVEGQNVKQWKLPNGAKVQLRNKDGSTFYYNSSELPMD